MYINILYLSLPNQPCFLNFRITEEVRLAKYLEVVAICRVLRWIWQNSEAALLELSVFHILRQLVPPLAANSSSLVALVSSAQLMQLLSLLLDRLVQLGEKMYLFVFLTMTSIENRFTR
jgi:hypothetical protein